MPNLASPTFGGQNSTAASTPSAVFGKPSLATRFNTPFSRQASLTVKPTQPSPLATLMMGQKAKTPTIASSGDNTLPKNQQAPNTPSTPTPTPTPNPTPSIVNVPNPGGGFTGYATGSTPPQQQQQSSDPNSDAPIGTNPNAAPQPSTLPGMLIAQGTAAAQAIPSSIQPGLGKYAELAQNISDVRRQAALGESANLTGGLMAPIAQGRAQNIANTEAQQENALGTQQAAALQEAQTAAGAQESTANQLGSLAGTAQTTTQAPYGTPLYQPSTGSFITPGAGTGAGGLDPQSQASQLAHLVTSGQMDFNTAAAQMGNYGVAGTSALRTAISQINPEFNYNLSQSSAQTQATGQQARTATTFANQALDQLQGAFNDLPGIQQTNIPLLNQLTQGAAMATGIGRDQASKFQGALNEARSSIDAVLSPLIGVDAANAQAHALLPDNMLPTEIPQKITAAKTYMQQKVDAYTQSGQQNQQPSYANTQSTASSGGGAFSDSAFFGSQQ